MGSADGERIRPLRDVTEGSETCDGIVVGRAGSGSKDWAANPCMDVLVGRAPPVAIDAIVGGVGM